MNKSKTSDPLVRGHRWVTAAEWFAGGRRIWYDPKAAMVRSHAPIGTDQSLRVFERTVTGDRNLDEDCMWLTMLPGFPDGSYGWAQVDRLLGEELVPRLYVEPVGQGDSDKPRDYRYSSVERADLVEALWRHHRVRRTVVVTFDYTSLALLELLRRRLERSHQTSPSQPVIAAVFMINGGLFADAHTHPWQGTPLLRSPLGALGMPRWQASSRVFAASMRRARMYSPNYQPSDAELTQMWAAVTRRDGAAFAHNASGFVKEHRHHADRWDLAAIAQDLHGAVRIYIGGSEDDPYEHRQIVATRRRVPEAEVIAFPGGHLVTSEHPGLLAERIREVAIRHGVGSTGQARPSTPTRQSLQREST